jgi:hypothetical protein
VRGDASEVSFTLSSPQTPNARIFSDWPHRELGVLCRFFFRLGASFSSAGPAPITRRSPPVLLLHAPRRHIPASGPHSSCR